MKRSRTSVKSPAAKSSVQSTSASKPLPAPSRAHPSGVAAVVSLGPVQCVPGFFPPRSPLAERIHGLRLRMLAIAAEIDSLQSERVHDTQLIFEKAWEALVNDVDPLLEKAHTYVIHAEHSTNGATAA